MARGRSLTSTLFDVSLISAAMATSARLVEVPSSLCAEPDGAVMVALDLNLDLVIGHHATKIGTRWTLSRRIRFELLDLLLEGNQRRAGLLS